MFHRLALAAALAVLALALAAPSLAAPHAPRATPFPATVTVDNGKVIRTDPPAGDKIDEGSTVTIVVSSGPELTAVPSVIGMAADAAKVGVDQPAQIVVGAVGAGNAEAAERCRQRFALAGRRQDRDLEAVGGEPARSICTHAAAARGDDGYFRVGHDDLLH